MSDLDALARRLVAHPRWEWRARIATNRGTVYDGEGLVLLRGARELIVPGPGSEPAYVWSGIEPVVVIPDLTDPATVGCLLAMLAASGVYYQLAVLPLGCVLSGELPDGRNIEERASTEGEAVALALLEVL